MMMLAHTHSTLNIDARPAGSAHDWVTQTLRQLTKRMDQLRCGLAGHNELLRYQPTRLSLQCANCGHQSPGWELGPIYVPREYPAAAFAPPVRA